jgi:hypothetical protein
LFSELKIQDKEELAWKRLKAEGLDKDGLKEAELRKKLTGKCNNSGSESKLFEVPFKNSSYTRGQASNFKSSVYV